MKPIFIFISSLFLFVSCTKNQETALTSPGVGPGVGAGDAVAATLSFDSPIRYQYKLLEEASQAAQAQGEPVSWSQLRSNEPALIELENRWARVIIEYVNGVATERVDQREDGAEPLLVEFFISEPKDPEAMGVLSSKSIQSSFAGFGNLGVVAKIEDQEITHNEIVEASMVNSRLYKNLFEQRMKRLDGIVIRRSLLKAAKGANLAMEAFVQEKILKGGGAATADQARTYALEQGISESDLNEKMIQRLQAIVDQKNRDRKIAQYIADHHLQDVVFVNFLVPQGRVELPTLSDAIPSYGSEKGKDLVYIGHWDCQSCKEALGLFLQGQREWGQTVKGTFLYYFQEQNREARMSAEAGLCLHEQKPDFFWQFVEASLQEESPNSEDTINRVAEKVGADFASFRKCFLARSHKEAVANQLATVKKMGVTRTPVLVANGKAFEQPTSLAPLAAALEISKRGGYDQQARMTNSASKKPGFLSRILAFFAGLF